MTDLIRSVSIVAVAGILAAAPFALDAGASRAGGPVFEGASAGTSVPFATLVLPPVVLGPGNEPTPAPAMGGTPAHGVTPSPRIVDDSFTPSFSQLVGGETIITTEHQMRHVWRRLFDAPYPNGLVDFETSFVVLMGGGLQLEAVGFEITHVEEFEASFADGSTMIPMSYLEYPLAIVATTFLPGPPPKEEVYEHKVAAVSIDRAHLGDIVFNRQVFAAP